MSIVKDLLFILIILYLFIKNISQKNEIKRQRNYFIDTLRHDLRVSTIAQIRGLEFLQKQNLFVSQVDFVNEVLNSCKFSLDMINMLLNTYMFEKGENILNYEKFNLLDLSSSICNMLNKFAKNKGIDFFYDIDSNAFINADKTSINKVLTIFISTAINNAENNSKLRLFIKKYQKSWKISVIYNGKSLSNEEYKRMFLDKPRFSTVGHGIKMQLCKKIIDFHKGKVFYENFGKNINAFTFLLPICNEDKSLKLNISNILNVF